MECLLIGLSENNTVILTMDHSGRMSCSLYVKNLSVVPVLPDLPLCLGVLKHRAPLARGGGGGGAYSCQKRIYDGFCGAILNLKVFCFGAIPDIMIELIVYGSVPQSRQS
jgi:hypothetical protein